LMAIQLVNQPINADISGIERIRGDIVLLI